MAYPALCLPHVMPPLLAIKFVAHLSYCIAKRAAVLHALVLLLHHAAGRHLMAAMPQLQENRCFQTRLPFPDWLAHMTSTPALTESFPSRPCLLCQVYLWVRVCGRSGAPGGHPYD